MEFITKIIITALAVIITCAMLPGVHIDGALTAVIIAAVLSLLNSFVKPVLIFFTLPLTIFTLGIFLLVINAAMILLAARLVDGFKVDGFWTALFFSIILSLINTLLNSLNKKKREE
jgi:putative membrane protein